MAKPETTPSADAGKTISVKARPGVARFCRAGLCFGPEAVIVRVDSLPKGGLDALQNEPNLVVEA